MLGVHDAEAALDFYARAFGAVEVGDRYPYEGKIGHAEMRIGEVLIMLADEFPDHNSSPKTLGGTPVILHLDVGDTDAAVNRACEAGATRHYEPMDQPYGRVCKITDPFGHVWMLNGPTQEV